MPGQFPTTIALADLNGNNGFKIDGELNGDYSGSAVSFVGDVNTDGAADVMIGAYGHNNGEGRSYVVFGGAGIGSSGVLSLSALNGQNGFKLDGESVGDQSGTAVSGAIDINGDHVTDFFIGAEGFQSYAGRSYSIFGGPGVGSSGTITLSDLNGISGFKIQGENPDDDSGYSLSGLGDINGDRIDDLLIGAYGVSNQVGRSYVVFGRTGIGAGGLLNLSSLNGANGFKLTGETAGDDSGWSVSGAGDVNGDGLSDLLIGAYGHNNLAGRSYLVFGQVGIGNGGVLALGTLNGRNGLILEGAAQGDRSGWSVSSAGDMNADGLADVLIGAWQHAGTGSSYVMLGGASGNANGVLGLSQLQGKNGFRLDGEASGDQCGYAVGGAGDINGDGIDDILIGASGHTGSQGRSYVVFGGSTVGSDGVITLKNLNGQNGFALDGEFTNDNSGGAVSSAGDVNQDGVDDLLIGAYRHNSNVGRTYVVFGDAPPILTRNQLSLSPGQRVVLTSNNLAATDRNHPLDSLVFVPGNLQHGRFEAINTSGLTIFNFTQSQIITGHIQFIHDGGNQPPAYQISVYSAGIAWCAPEPANIQFTMPHQELSAGAWAAMGVSVGVIVSLMSYLIYYQRRKGKCKAPCQEVKSESIPMIDNVQWQDLEFGPLIGEGGYGVVYRGTYRYNQVAIKQLRAERFSSMAVAELKQEAQIMAMMRSDYIVQWRGACFETSRVCLVMELMPKGSLHQLLQNQPDLKFPVLLQMGLDIIYGLYQLHENGILHRDLKSLNVLLNDRLRAKISDFGLSKIKSEIKSESLISKDAKTFQGGTLNWMAPELFKKQPASRASDIYAYGMILWELMVKPYQIPFFGLMGQAIISAKLTREKNQETVPKKCPPLIAQTIRSCWRESSQRPTAKELAESLTPLLQKGASFSLPGSQRVNLSSVKSDVLSSGTIPDYEYNLMSS